MKFWICISIAIEYRREH